MSLENYIKNRNAICYVFPNKKKDDESNQGARNLNLLRILRSLFLILTIK